jgi:hypothetical protein
MVLPRGDAAEAYRLLLGPLPFWLIGHRRITAALTFLRDAGLRG